MHVLHGDAEGAHVYMHARGLTQEALHYSPSCHSNAQVGAQQLRLDSRSSPAPRSNLHELRVNSAQDALATTMHASTGIGKEQPCSTYVFACNTRNPFLLRFKAYLQAYPLNRTPESTSQTTAHNRCVLDQCIAKAELWCFAAIAANTFSMHQEGLLPF